jgi:hypothetical protein
MPSHWETRHHCRYEHYRCRDGLCDRTSQKHSDRTLERKLFIRSAHANSNMSFQRCNKGVNAIPCDNLGARAVTATLVLQGSGAITSG